MKHIGPQEYMTYNTIVSDLATLEFSKYYKKIFNNSLNPYVICAHMSSELPKATRIGKNNTKAVCAVTNTICIGSQNSSE